MIQTQKLIAKSIIKNSQKTKKKINFMVPLPIEINIINTFIKELASLTSLSTSSFTNENIVTDHVKLFKPSDETKAKIHATKTINKLIKSASTFKIGKSGSPAERNRQHKNFTKMFLIIESKNQGFIDKLEGIYNERYIALEGNKNKKIGSAGEMTGKNGRYFLYFIVNTGKI